MATYLEKIQSIAKEFSTQEKQNECMFQAKSLHKKGFSYQWVYEALAHKDIEDWEIFGFGLLHTDSYKAQINKLVQKKKEQLTSVDLSNLWKLDDDEAEQESPIPAQDKLRHNISILLEELNLGWDDVLAIAEGELGVTAEEKEILDTIPDDIVSAPIEIEKDYSDAPKWFNKYSGKWETFDPKEFTEEITTRNPAISMDVRNIDAIRYALENNIVPASNIAYFQRLLEAAERLS